MANKNYSIFGFLEQEFEDYNKYSQNKMSKDVSNVKLSKRQVPKLPSLPKTPTKKEEDKTSSSSAKKTTPKTDYNGKPFNYSDSVKTSKTKELPKTSNYYDKSQDVYNPTLDKIADKVTNSGIGKNIVRPFTVGAISPLTDLANIKASDEDKAKYEKATSEYNDSLNTLGKISKLGGNIGVNALVGSALPIANSSKVINATKGITNPILNTMAREGIENLAYGGIANLPKLADKNYNGLDYAKDTALEGVGGALFGGAIKGIGDGVSKVKQGIKDYKNLDNILSDVTDFVDKNARTVETNTVVPNQKNTKLTTQKTESEKELANLKKIIKNEDKRIANTQSNLKDLKNPILRNIDLENADKTYNEQVKLINDEIARRKGNVDVEQELNNLNLKPFVDRNFNEVQTDYRQLKGSIMGQDESIDYHLKDYANMILEDSKRGIKGGNDFIDMETNKPYNGGSLQSDTFEIIQGQTKKTYKEIQDSLNRIANGQVTNTLDRRIEIILDDSLINGTRLSDGTIIPPNDSYIENKTLFEQLINDKDSFYGINKVNSNSPQKADIPKPKKTNDKLLNKIMEDVNGNDLEEHTIGEFLSEDTHKMLVEKSNTLKLSNNDYDSLIHLLDGKSKEEMKLHILSDVYDYKVNGYEVTYNEMKKRYLNEANGIKNKPLVKTKEIKQPTNTDNNVLSIMNDVNTGKTPPKLPSLTQNTDIKSVAKDLGIDLDTTLSNMQKAEQLTPKQIAEQNRWKQIIGVTDRPTNIVGSNKYVPRNSNIPKTVPQLPDLKSNSNVLPTSNVNTPNINKNIPTSLVDENKAMQEVASTTDKYIDENGIERIPQKILFSDEVTKENLNIFDKVKKSWGNFKTRAIDINAPLKDVNEETYRLATNSKVSGGIVNGILENGLVDKNGKVVGKSLKDIVKDTPRDFYEYMAQRVNVYRASRDKNVLPGFNVLDSVKAVDSWEKLNPSWKAKGDELNNWVDTFMKTWGVDTGIVEEDFYKALREMDKDYLPLNKIMGENDITGYMNKKGFVNQNVPMNKAKGNSDKDLQHPVENLINMVDRVVRTAKYNEVGQSFLKEVNSNNKFDNIVKVFADNEEIPTGKNNIVSVLVDGKKVNMEINDKAILNSLESLYKNTSNDSEKWLKSANTLFKDLITQYNPLFAFFNAFRDGQNFLINSKEGNVFKNLFNLASAYTDIFRNTDVYKQYKSVGGGGGNFVRNNSPKIGRELIDGKKFNPFKATIDGISNFNNAFENAPRLAEFKNTLSRGEGVDDALYDSLDVTTNFSRGGDVTKAWNDKIPFLNASVQGLDKLRRQTLEKPIQTVIKGATVITTPTLLLNYINKDNENYKMLDNRTKDTYYVIPTKDGKFLKLPKSRDFGTIFGALTERVIRRLSGEENAFKGYGESVKNNLAPVNPLQNNLAKPLYDLMANKDFANRTIVPQSMLDSRKNKDQYDETTSEIGKKIGDMMNWSPKQVDYLIDSYTGVIGDILLPLTTTKGEGIEQGSKNAFNRVVRNKFIADSVYNNQPIQDFYDTLDNLNKVSGSNDFNNTKNSKYVDGLKTQYNKLSKEYSTLSKDLKGETNEELIRVKKLELIKKMDRLNQEAQRYKLKK